MSLSWLKQWAKSKISVSGQARGGFDEQSDADSGDLLGEPSDSPTDRGNDKRETIASVIRASLADKETQQCLSPEEKNALESVLHAFENLYLAVCADFVDLKVCLVELWTTGLDPRECRNRPGTMQRLAMPEQAAEQQRDWKIGMSDEFLKSIKKIDKKLKGRVLEAIEELVRAPTIAVGDTVKRLTGAKTGIWRYRIGEYRLLYLPVDDCVILVNFGPRGSVYDD
jgi:mRNA interferase RelE/StbE